MDEKSRQATRLWTLAQPKVSAYVTSVVRDFKDRDDVLQDIAVAVIDSFDTYDPGRSFDA
ncbi:MAG: RNA polymerase factor sigma-70, partial [Fuerstiella sp.]|nr:RNA polymerase factor sigma-70 [Fuerstiella sp.]